ncbi:Dna2/Cas4 domain-containing protein, partial [Salmonella enterica subsp. enterica serovar Anatum]|nr:Dna2/Cas4 domain-containing protein [Salmonella enterica subsp. enterica serovar Anatum]
QCARQMHEVFKSGILPKANKQHHCKNCSLVNLCMPEMSDCTLVSTYLNLNSATL